MYQKKKKLHAIETMPKWGAQKKGLNSGEISPFFYLKLNYSMKKRINYGA
jgi:hypothetical protein